MPIQKLATEALIKAEKEARQFMKKLREFTEYVLNEQLTLGDQGDTEYIRMAYEALSSINDPEMAVCVEGFGDTIYKGRYYEIIETLHADYFVRCDDGHIRAFSKKRFKPKED